MWASRKVGYAVDWWGVLLLYDENVLLSLELKVTGGDTCVLFPPPSLLCFQLDFGCKSRFTI